MDLSGVLSAANPSSKSTAADKSKFGNDYNQFLNLLTTQLKNQDPLSPMDSAQFTNQLVQFSSVEQQIKSNDYLQKLLTLNTLSLTGVGLGYVGMNVFSPGNTFQSDGASSTALSYTMPAGATAGNLSITDASGSTVFSKVADLSAGNHNFVWDGKDNNGNAVPAGTYKLNIGAQDNAKNALNVSTYTSGLVQGLETGEDGNVSLIINGKQVPVTDVRQATLPTYTYAPSTGTNVAG
jgi:flagellar basal-body rod modification protein FlgD